MCLYDSQNHVYVKFSFRGTSELSSIMMMLRDDMFGLQVMVTLNVMCALNANGMSSNDV